MCASQSSASLGADQPTSNFTIKQSTEDRLTSDVVTSAYKVSHRKVDYSSHQKASTQMPVNQQQLPFFELSSDAMCVLDAQGRCIRINPAFSKILGYSQAEMQLQSLSSIVHPDDRSTHEAAIAKSLTYTGQQTSDVKGIESDSTESDSTAIKNITCRYQHQSGEYRWLSLSVATTQSSDTQSSDTQSSDTQSSDTQSSDLEQQHKQLYCVARDITASRQNNQKQLANVKAEYQARYSELQRSTKETRSRIRKVKREAQMYANAVENMQIGLLIWQLEENSSQINNKPSNQKTENNKATLRLIASNPAAKSATGIDTSTLIGQTIEEAFPALSKTNLPHTYIQVIRSGLGCDIGEVTYGDERVKESIFNVKAFPLNDQCVGIAFENITQQRQYEKAHQSQTEQLRVIFNQAGIGMAILSSTGKWLQVNQKLCSLLGYTNTELLTKSFADVALPKDIDTDQDLFQQLISGEQDQITFEKRYATQNGSTLWTLVTLSIVREHIKITDSGTSYSEIDVSSKSLGSEYEYTKNAINSDKDKSAFYFIATIQDITERKQSALSLEEQKNDLVAVNIMLTSTMSQLEERNKELDQFAYVTSHDLRAPLRAINNLAGWIEEDIGDHLPTESKRQFDLLKSRVRRMEGLINGLLEYSRVARTHQSHERIDTAELVTTIFDSLSPPESFTLEISSELPVLEARKKPLMQIFLNLISNAIMHHDRTDGTVRVSAKELDQFYEFSVSDDGPGIEPAYHEKIFVIFQTLQARDKLESTGIGLSLVKKIVNSEGGKVSVESEIGKGATFKVTWPKSPSQGIRFA